MSHVRLVAITKHYGQMVAVQELNLDVADGEFVTLLGPSGCGKTTTLRMVAGLIEPTSGQIYVDEQEVTYLRPHAGNIAFGLSVKGQKKAAIQQRIDEMLSLVGLSGYGTRLPAQLSGGQQQRV